MSAARISAKRPVDVADEVAVLVKSGCRRFVIAAIDGGGMLDQERLGAARYAAGLQSRVELELRVPAAAPSR